VIHLLRQAWDRLALFLPVVLMGVLALGTYWLVRSTPGFSESHPEQAKRHEPDYFIQQFSVKTFDLNGRLKSEVLGTQARHYPDTDTLEIDQVRMRNFNDKGQLTTASANRALSNADSSEIQLMGNAVVVREATQGKDGTLSPEMGFRGEFLHAFIDAERLKSHKPVELSRGKDHFAADSLEFDNFDSLLVLQGRVRGVLMPGQPTSHR
jgi:lipopolysaccharide export system protein LptC